MCTWEHTHALTHTLTLLSRREILPYLGVLPAHQSQHTVYNALQPAFLTRYMTPQGRSSQFFQKNLFLISDDRIKHRLSHSMC